MKYSIYKSILLFTFVLFLNGFVFAQTDSQKGIELYTQGDFKGTIETLQKAVETDEKDYKALLYLGAAFVKTGDKKQALNTFRKTNKISDDKKAKAMSGENLKANDRKIKIISRPKVSYTESARRNLVQGTIKLAVEFGADGKIKFVFPFEEIEYGLTENAIKAANKIKFEPAIENGKPITSIAVVEYNFAIF